jgi:hypothetical protein
MVVRMDKKEQKRANGNFKDGLIDKESLMYDLDFVFSRYIRIKEANPDGTAECYTCDKREHWTKLQAGHFIKRSETFLRWDTRNVRPQCVECNCLNHGNIEAYSERLENEQPGIVETLKEQSKDVYKYTREDMKELLVDLRAKLKMVQSKLK